ncbi:hypothetical protein LZ554_008727 [Drepanopeziza brunnea f. sp. 'monogermtubi']|nr:hypothetical protein LZ554_008727 [Drepanopeziza brunnea f. sp. 'monogermtubi']
MLFINAFLAATTFAIATAQSKRTLKLCQDPGYKKCFETPYIQDDCITLSTFGMTGSVTSIGTHGYGCEFYVHAYCETADGYFAHRGDIDDLLKTDYAFANDALSSFRCGT